MKKTSSYGMALPFLLLVFISLSSGCSKSLKDSQNSVKEATTKITTIYDDTISTAIYRGDSMGFDVARKIMSLSPGLGRQLVSDAFIADNSSPCRRVEVAIWAAYSDGNHNDVQVSVDPDFVLIGGGARVTNFSNTDAGINAILTAAYPINDGSFTTYSAASKDHGMVYSHRLWTYAIGMKLYTCEAHQPYVPPALITPFMNIATAVSPMASHPYISVPIPSGYTAISGGAYINYGSGAGNLLVENGTGLQNSPTYLAAQGKDQKVVSPATVTAYCLSIQNNAVIGPFFGQLDIQKNFNAVLNNNQHYLSISSSAFPGYLLSGIAAYSTYTQYGRVLYAMYPQTSTAAIASSKDQEVSDVTGGLQVEISMIRPLP